MSNPLIDDAAERAVLGSILVRNAAMDEVGDQLEPETFGKPHHQVIYAALQRLHQRGVALDMLTLRDELSRGGQVDEVGGPMYVASLADGTPRSMNVKHYAAIVRDKAVKRRLREAARRILEFVDAEEGSAETAIQNAEQAVFAVSASAVRDGWISSLELVTELAPVIDRIAERRSAVTGVASGFTDLDVMTRGFHPGDLVLLGARPSQGKTAFGINVAMSAAAVMNVAVFSIEMSREGIGMRQVVSLADVDGWRLLSGRLSEIEMFRVSEGLTRLGEQTIWLNEAPDLNPMQARSSLRRLCAQVGHVGLVIIDYLQLMAPMPSDKREAKVNQVAGISRALKIMARDFGCPFLVLSQLHRVPENRRPTMADLRDSGALEQDADVVLLLHRPEVYEPKPENAGLAELIVGKQRNGPTGIVELTWRAAPMRFENRARQTERRAS